mgnify:CR=1 FL=1
MNGSRVTRNGKMQPDRILSLIMAIALIMALCFLAFVLQDLNNLWTESEELWEMFDDHMTIIQKQEDRIRDLQILIISKAGIGV